MDVNIVMDDEVLHKLIRMVEKNELVEELMIVVVDTEHIERQCTKPKRQRYSAWFKEKMLLVQAQESVQVLDEEQLAFLADLGIPDGQATQTTIPHNAAFQTDDLDAYDSDCDDISSAKAVFMANLYSYDSDVPSKVPQHDTYQNNDMIDDFK
nr:hypothetical protein [Tanacetum cinerariifolium]